MGDVVDTAVADVDTVVAVGGDLEHEQVKTVMSVRDALDAVLA